MYVNIVLTPAVQRTTLLEQLLDSCCHLKPLNSMKFGQGLLINMANACCESYSARKGSVWNEPKWNYVKNCHG